MVALGTLILYIGIIGLATKNGLDGDGGDWAVGLISGANEHAGDAVHMHGGTKAYIERMLVNCRNNWVTNALAIHVEQ